MKRQPKLTHTQIARLPRILNMKYTPDELADEIGVHRDTIYRSYMRRGLPYTKENFRIYIYGPAFVEWAKQIMALRKRTKLEDDEAYCVSCKKGRKILNPNIVYQSRYTETLQGKCIVCGAKANRMRKRTAVS